MCLAVPVRLKEKKSDALGTFEYGGVLKDVSLQLLSEVNEGDYILVHAGFAIEKLDEAEAEETLVLMREMAFLKAADEQAAEEHN
ncbi:MAG: HypC/HybG/HupF family hydrogenase formation chaperone [bacterium]